jgi:HEAT repeat protein
MGNRGTPALIKAIWPDCSQCTTPIDGYDLYDAMVKMLARRETLMWFSNNINTPVNHARVEAGYLMQGPPKALEGANLEKTIGLLKSKDPLTRYFAIVELGESNNPKALPALQACLGEKDWVLQRAAVAAMGQIGDAKAIGPLADILRQGASDMQTFAAHSLRLIGKPALPALLEAASNSDAKIALAAVSAIGGLALPEAAGPMCRLVDNAKATVAVRAKAIQSLGLIGNDVADEKVLSILETSSDATLLRAAATAVTYGNITGPRAVKAIQTIIDREKSKLADKTVEKLDPKWMALLGHALSKAK